MLKPGYASNAVGSISFILTWLNSSWFITTPDNILFINAMGIEHSKYSKWKRLRGIVIVGGTIIMYSKKGANWYQKKVLTVLKYMKLYLHKNSTLYIVNLLISIFLLWSKPFTSILTSGVTIKTLISTVGRLDLTHKKPNFPPTGTHPSPRSALVWRSASRSSLLSSTSKRIHCTP